MAAPNTWFLGPAATLGTAHALSPPSAPRGPHGAPAQYGNDLPATAAPGSARPPSSPPRVRVGRKSFSESLYRSLLRLAPEKKAQVQAVFRFFKAHMADLPQKEVQAVLVTALGMDLVRAAWAEARKEMEEHVQADLARMLRPYTYPGPNSAAAAEDKKEEEEDRSSRARQEEKARRVRPHMGLVRQGTLFWRAGDAMPSAQTGDDGASIVLTMACLSPATEADQDAMPRLEEEKAAAERPPTAVVDAMEDDEFLLEGAPEAFLCPISLQLLVDPVVAGDGFAYNRTALETWIVRNRLDRMPLRSPMTNAPMSGTYTPSFTLRSLVHEYVERKRAAREMTHIIGE